MAGIGAGEGEIVNVDTTPPFKESKIYTDLGL